MIYINSIEDFDCSNGMWIKASNNYIRVKDIEFVSRIYSYGESIRIEIKTSSGLSYEIGVYLDLEYPKFLGSLFNTKKYRELLKRNEEREKVGMKLVEMVRDYILNVAGVM